MKLDQVADRKLNNFGDRKWRTTHSVEMYLFGLFSPMFTLSYLIDCVIQPMHSFRHEIDEPNFHYHPKMEMNFNCLFYWEKGVLIFA